MSVRLLDPVRSVKVKLGVLVAASVTVAAVVGAVGSDGGVPLVLGLPVTILIGLAVTQLLAVGMTSPLREMTAAAARMAGGDHAVRVTATSRDEIGDLARAFNRMATELEGVDRHRRELVANVSHELRTPLAALCAVLENLADGVSEPDPAALRAALAQGERMTALVGDLLDLSRADAGRAPVRHEPVVLADLLAAAVAEPRVLGRDVSYVVAVDPPAATVEGDPARLGQLVANLLDNAARHSPPGGTVTLTAGVRDGRWHLVVADEGPGVAPADRERAFARFGTLTETDGGGGTGLGLAIARWVADLHGGTIGFVDPEPGGSGARVRVELPTEPETATLEAVPAEVSAPPPAPVAAPPVSDAVFGDLWPDRSVPGNLRIAGGALAVGLLAGIVLPYRDHGIGLFLVLLAAGGVLLAAARHRRDRFTLACAALCTALSGVVVLRDAEWVVALCCLTAIVVCAAGLTRGTRVPGFALACLAWPFAALRGMPWLGRTLRGLTGRGSGALLRTGVWSLAGVVVFALLLASADALFAEWVDAVVPDLGSPDAALRTFIAVAVAGVVLAGAYLALDPPAVDGRPRVRRPVAQRFEWLVPVLVVDAVLALFLVAQATVVFGGHDYLERTTGLTYAEYVHQGFGQLTVVTALTLLVVWAAMRKASQATPADRAWIRGSLGLLGALTLVVVASALHRMHLYQDAYGFTRMRLLVDVFEGWLGLLVVATMAGGIALKGAWLPRFGLLSGATLLLGLALVNPDAWIARQNLDRYESSGEVDWTYLRGLSEDAAGTLATLPDDVVRCALDATDRSDDDWLEWNLGRHRADDVLTPDLLARPQPFPCPGQTED